MSEKWTVEEQDRGCILCDELGENLTSTIVAAHDDIYKIARRYNSVAEALKNANDATETAHRNERKALAQVNQLRNELRYLQSDELRERAECTAAEALAKPETMAEELAGAKESAANGWNRYYGARLMADIKQWWDKERALLHPDGQERYDKDAAIGRWMRGIVDTAAWGATVPEHGEARSVSHRTWTDQDGNTKRGWVISEDYYKDGEGEYWDLCPSIDELIEREG